MINNFLFNLLYKKYIYKFQKQSNTPENIRKRLRLFLSELNRISL